MSFIGMKISSPWVSNGNFPATYENFLEGSYRSVATTLEMNQIPSLRRKEGMLVRVLDTNTVYIYDGTNFVVLNEVANIPVDMSNLADGRVMAYNASTQEFEFVDMGAGSSGPQFVYHQSTPATTWNIVHNLNKVPAVIAVDDFGNVIYTGITIVNSNELTINTNPATTGYIYLV